MSESESDNDDGRTHRTYAEILAERQNDEGYATATSKEQDNVEIEVLKLYKLQMEPQLISCTHIGFLKKSLIQLNEQYQCLDCSRPWLCYWILHTLQILGEDLQNPKYSKVVGFLAKCQSPDGGFGGGPGQYPHLASTYAAVNALCIIGTIEAYETINRKGLLHFLTSLRGEDGAFSMHVDGEVDIRGVYCAITVAKLTNVYTLEMFKGSAEWIAQCQTWEGGFGGCPGMEAHGGYAFCGIATLVLLGKSHLCHVPSLMRWLVNKQMRLEGGFQGRTNKLVDACYSFWQSGAFPLISAILSNEGKVFDSNYWLFDQKALQEYLLICCQHPFGGLVDKPKKNSDLYHTCYAISGLSIAQHSRQSVIVGHPNLNRVGVIHPVFNLIISTVSGALTYFGELPIPD
ncbi:protein farnesyltransferase subunit beta isoform X2 [Orussus abietinus]|nr:protein farnesyltransferase subunit beta isoform X2 [Orussus abietinus]XP_012283380.1 protein farnesyltransferase subunit beta isoform X2 [Orussus abietinus]XP_012283381.1 protein farnesyltransferase subunit beta isoform X2 [Orussus abietinus]